MIDSNSLQNIILEYVEDCKVHSRSPSRKGLAERLKCSTGTVCNVIHGYFAHGKPYTDKPHIRRMICNDDFPEIRAIFGGK